jgi:hypothetical protein
MGRLFSYLSLIGASVATFKNSYMIFVPRNKELVISDHDFYFTVRELFYRLLPVTKKIKRY